MIFLWIFLLILGALLLLWLFLILPRLRRPTAVKALHQAQYAHRGLHNIQKGIPENSLLAFRRAVEAGYGIELDVHLTRDGKLVVEHDDHLRRTCGSELIIEDCDYADLKDLTLEGTAERLPLLEEVFALVDGKVPLLVEVKVFRGNHQPLCAAVYAALRQYKGAYCVESFDPRAIAWFRRNAKEVVRGQLAGYIRKHGNSLHPAADFALRHLLVNVLGRPDFIAYHYKDARNLSLRICKTLYRAPIFLWTVRNERAQAVAKRLDAAPIFEEPKQEVNV
ncbi:MAG: glycerophosphodiester phosphodiesterase [Clostridia bacterium]|nr:glycerophosphodiester phosphodiesterase [Clostridia bacterium]